MNITDFLVKAAQASAEKPSLFPFPFPTHLVFSIVAVLFLLFQFKRHKQPYQLIMAVAVPISLLIWLSEERAIFYIVGIIELVLVAAALVTYIIGSVKESKKKKKEAASAPAENAVEEAVEEASEDKTESDS